MAIADKLTELQATKTAIKTAIEDKGQDLTDVPFTEYAGAITAIQGGEDLSVVVKTIVDVRASAFYLFYCASPSYGLTDDFIDKVINYDTFENATSMWRTFFGCAGITYISSINTKKSVDFADAFMYCYGLKTIGELDVGAATNLNRIFRNCSELQDVDIRNINVSISFSDSPKLTKECVLKILYALNEASSRQTLTVHADVMAMIDGLNVREDGGKLVEDSTGDSASEYAILKNWDIAG